MKYGENSEVGPKDLIGRSFRTTFQLKLNKEEYTFQTNLIGKHNVLNLAAVIIYALTEGFTKEEIANAIKDLQMVKRRQEVRGVYKGALVITILLTTHVQ